MQRQMHLWMSAKTLTAMVHNGPQFQEINNQTTVSTRTSTSPGEIGVQISQVQLIDELDPMVLWLPKVVSRSRDPLFIGKSAEISSHRPSLKVWFCSGSRSSNIAPEGLNMALRVSLSISSSKITGLFTWLAMGCGYKTRQTDEKYGSDWK